MLGLRSMYLVLFIIFAHTMPRVTSDSLPLSCLFLSPVYPPLRQCPNRETFKKKKKKNTKESTLSWEELSCLTSHGVVMVDNGHFNTPTKLEIFLGSVQG